MFFRKRLPTRKYLWLLIIAYIGYHFAQYIFNDSFSSTGSRVVKPEVLDAPPEVHNEASELQNEPLIQEPEVPEEPESAPEVGDIFEQIKIETNLEKLQELNKQIQVRINMHLARIEPITFIFRSE